MTTDLIVSERPGLRVLSWTLLRKGALLGTCDVALPIGITLRGVLVFEAHGKRWATPPGIPVLDRERRQIITPQGKPDYKACVTFHTKEIGALFSQKVLEALSAFAAADGKAA